MHHELAVTHSSGLLTMRWKKKHWRSAGAVHQQLQGLIQIWYIYGTNNQLNLGSLAATKELARQVQDKDGSTSNSVVAPRGKVEPPGAGKAGRRRDGMERFGGPDVGMNAVLQASMLVPSSGVVADLSVSGGLGVALPCASAKRARLLPEGLMNVRLPYVCSVVVKGPSFGK